MQLDEIFNIFNPPTRKAVQQNLQGFGDTFTARGADINRTIGALPSLLRHLQPVASYLSAPSTGLTRCSDRRPRNSVSVPGAGSSAITCERSPSRIAATTGAPCPPASSGYPVSPRTGRA